MPVAPAMLERMSLRTMPARISALATPLTLLLVPSPGYGPPVSSGITAHAVLDEAVVGAVVVAVVDATLAPPPPQPAIGSAAAPANSQRSDWRRLAVMFSIVSISAARLWSWCSISILLRLV